MKYLSQLTLLISLLSVFVLVSTLLKVNLPFLPRTQHQLITAMKPTELLYGEEPILGTGSAAVKLVMFGDYECPPCRAEWPQIEALHKRHQGNLDVYFKQFPLLQIHPLALSAAGIVSARSGSTRAKLHSVLFANPVAPLRKHILLDAMKRHRIGREEINSLPVLKRVHANIVQGERLGVASTPSIFIIKDQTMWKANSIESIERELP